MKGKFVEPRVRTANS